MFNTKAIFRVKNSMSENDHTETRAFVRPTGGFTIADYDDDDTPDDQPKARRQIDEDDAAVLIKLIFDKNLDEYLEYLF